ncbi:MAG: hypothetical protein ACXVHP_02710, partial [Methanobacterium sp.]
MLCMEPMKLEVSRPRKSKIYRSFVEVLKTLRFLGHRNLRFRMFSVQTTLILNSISTILLFPIPKDLGTTYT